MKLLKRIGIAVLALVGILLIVALFLPKEYTVERSVVIAQPKDSVFAYVKYLKHQNDYSKWAGMDPAMKKEFRGTDAQPGFVSAWESQKDDVGSGEQTIKSIDASGRIEYDLHFIEPFEAHADSWMVTETEGSGTKVRWGMHGRMAYPTNLMLLCYDMDDAIGTDLNIGLTKLKKKLEGGR
ncbi:SRPBCC family protein [Flaviaesturariibacter amylovorans]|uniref:Polyketide cyclase n=1 Tax=Flaviaesturariibacter amylovorans TaxID=1084520 RepID=A0ABP8GNI4_9BACT